MPTTNINPDLSIGIALDTQALQWQPSPSGTVWRKRLYLDGQVESGKVTSIVKYEPNASFPAHDHPQGEEILVLEGVFSDEHGDWPAGSYLLNPEGFHHAPFSTEGCLIFVRLRQYAGQDRKHVALNANQLKWLSSKDTGKTIKPLYAQDGYSEEMRLERWAPNTTIDDARFPRGAEIMILQGSIRDSIGQHDALSWIRLPENSTYSATTTDGCELLIRTTL